MSKIESKDTSVIYTKNRFMNPQELELSYGFSVNNQAQMRMKKKIPFIKIGGYVRYDREAINQWLVSNAIGVVS